MPAMPWRSSFSAVSPEPHRKAGRSPRQKFAKAARFEGNTKVGRAAKSTAKPKRKRGK